MENNSTQNIGPSYHTVESLGVLSYEVPASERHPDGARFTVIVDGQRIPCSSLAKLRRELVSIYAPTPTIFKNLDRCVTIDFDC